MDAVLQAYVARREAAIETVREILRDKLHVEAQLEEIDPDAPLFGSGFALDSVDALELVVATEAAFGVRIPEDELRPQLRTIDTLVDLVLALQGLRGEAAS